MADSTTSTFILGVGLEYEDTETAKTKTTYLKIPNPKDDLTEQQIKTAVHTLIDGENPVLLDSYGNAFNSNTAIATAYTETQEVIDIEIN